MVDKEMPDLILLDMRLPFMGGIEVCKKIKGTSKLKCIPVILFTAQYMSEECVEAESKNVGAADYILKPFDAHTLLAKIKSLIK